VHNVSAVTQISTVVPTDNVRNAVSVPPAVPHNSLASSSLVMDTDFAATVNKNKDKLDDMQVVMKKNKKNKKKVIVGATENAVFKGVCKKSVVCVSRLEPGTTADIVRDHLISNSIDVLSCYDLNNTDSSRFTRVRVCVPLYDLDRVLSPDMWPKGVTVRPWVFKTRNNVSTDNTDLRHGYDDAE